MLTSWGSELRKLTVYLPATGAKLVWVSKIEPEEGDRMVTVIVWLLGIVNIPSKEVKLTVLGNLVADILLTVMVTADVVKVFPALSKAVAVLVWVPLVKVVVSKDLDREPVV